MDVGNFRTRKWRAAKRIGVPCILRITDSASVKFPTNDFRFKQDRGVFIIFNQVIFFFND